MKAVIYMRVSTGDQSVEPQRLELRDYCAWRGWTVVEAEEVDDVISGAKASRVGLDRVMDMARSRRIQAIVCAKIDRLARSLAHFAQIVMECDGLGAALVFPSQAIDTSISNPAGRLQMHVLASVAEFERTLISERTKAGLAAARAAGKKLGRPAAKLPVNWREIVATWKADPGRTYRGLASMLGGVGIRTAFRCVKRTA